MDDSAEMIFTSRYLDGIKYIKAQIFYFIKPSRYNFQ